MASEGAGTASLSGSSDPQLLLRAATSDERWVVQQLAAGQDLRAATGTTGEYWGLEWQALAAILAMASCDDEQCQPQSAMSCRGGKWGRPAGATHESSELWRHTRAR